MTALEAGARARDAGAAIIMGIGLAHADPATAEALKAAGMRLRWCPLDVLLARPRTYQRIGAKVPPPHDEVADLLDRLRAHAEIVKASHRG